MSVGVGVGVVSWQGLRDTGGWLVRVRAPERPLDPVMRSAERSTDVSLATTVARLVGAIEWRPSMPSILDDEHLWQSTEPQLPLTCATLDHAAGRGSRWLGRVVER